MPPVLGEALGNLSDDDYVAQVLAKEARDNSAKYAAQGLGAYMPKRPTTGAPKPNTRFLRNIIRSTDSHNASLRRKEEREARERKRLLQDRSSSHPHASRRHDLHSDELESKGRRREGREDRHRHSHRRRHRSRSISAERDESRRRRRRSRPDDIDDDRSHRSSRGDRRHDRDERYRSRRRRSSSRSRSRSPRDRRRRGSRRHRHERSSHRSASSRSRSRSRSPQRSKSHRVKDDDGWQKRQRSRERLHRREERTPSPPENPQNKYLGEESDPLEDLVGPLPPNMNGLDAAAMRSRGRGAYKTAASNIDDHFAPDYDPTLDVHPKDDDASNTLDRPTRRPVPGLMDGEDDWDLALEALRDRVRWRQKGEERLREAGFNEDVVERWKNDAAFTNSGETEEVKWSKKGEGREWDRGKVVGEDGHVDVKAPW